MANPFVHVELMTTDVNKAKAFYSGATLALWQMNPDYGKPAA